MRRHIHALIHRLGTDFPPLSYCPRCGGHYPPHSH
jgi:hypothetical protein